MTSASTMPAEEAMGRRQILKALSGLLLVLFTAMTSSTIVSTALPKIIESLNGSQTQYTWVVTATLLTATASTPIWGKISDLYDKKLLVQIAIVVFLLGSVISGFAQNVGQLIAARAFQGLGVGGLQALVQVVIAAMIPPRERGRYNGILGAVMALATVGGPVLGGVITDTSWMGWRWCFFFGVPLAIVALAVLHRTLHLRMARAEQVHVDYPGAALIAIGVSTLLIWVSFVDDSFAWLSWQTALMVGAGVLILVVATWWESRATEPVVPLNIIRQRTPALAIIASLSVGMAMFGGAVFLGQYFQVSRGYSPTAAGLLMAPMMVGVLVSSTVVGLIITKTGKIKPYLILGAALLISGFGVLATIDEQTSMAVVSSGLVLVGIGVGATMQNLVLAVQNTVALRDIGAASGMVTFFRTLGGTIGVSVLGAVLARRVAGNMEDSVAEAGMPPASTDSEDTSNLNLEELPQPIVEFVQNAYGEATGYIFLISLGVACVSLIAVLALKPIRLRNTLDLDTASESAANETATEPATTVGTD